MVEPRAFRRLRGHAAPPGRRLLRLALHGANRRRRSRRGASTAAHPRRPRPPHGTARRCRAVADRVGERRLPLQPAGPLRLQRCLRRPEPLRVRRRARAARRRRLHRPALQGRGPARPQALAARGRDPASAHRLPRSPVDSRRLLARAKGRRDRRDPPRRGRHRRRAGRSCSGHLASAGDRRDGADPLRLRPDGRRRHRRHLPQGPHRPHPVHRLAHGARAGPPDGGRPRDRRARLLPARLLARGPRLTASVGRGDGAHRHVHEAGRHGAVRHARRLARPRRLRFARNAAPARDPRRARRPGARTRAAEPRHDPRLLPARHVSRPATAVASSGSRRSPPKRKARPARPARATACRRS